MINTMSLTNKYDQEITKLWDVIQFLQRKLEELEMTMNQYYEDNQYGPDEDI